MYSVDCCPKGLVIGKQGENEAEKIAVDFSPWVSEFGAGTISARLRRPKDSAAYPVVLTTDGTTATWTVSATDTQYAGAGSLQLVYFVGDVVAKSVIWPVRVLPSLEAGEAPEPYESWLDTLEGLAADTQGNARDAAASAADAAQSATSAAASAQDAAGSAASITGLTAVAQTLPEGSEASASFDGTTDTLTLGIPKGDTGAAGPAGPKGDTGADGFSPSATVTKQDGNIVITVTDKDGTTSETLEVDNALDEDSVNPVQNAAIVEAMRSMLPVDTASGAIASFPDGADDVPMLSLKAQIEPVQDLHGYDYPWPAGGGKNQFDYDTTYAAFKQSDGTFRGIAQQVIQISYRIPSEMVGSQLTFSAFLDLTNSGEVTWVRCRANVSGSWLNGNSIANGASGYSSVTFTPTSTDDYVMLDYGPYGSNPYTFSEIQLEVSASRTSFAPYENVCPISGHTGVNISHSGADMTNPDVIPISWESEAGTVYGGEIEIVSGKLTSRMAMVDLGTLTWTDQSNENQRSYYSSILEDAKKPSSTAVTSNALCPMYKTAPSTGFVSAGNALITISPARRVNVNDNAYDNTVDFESAMSGVQLVYELATPIEYQLTPQEVRTFLGQNNLWSDTGNTEVTYRADIQKYIEKKVSG